MKLHAYQKTAVAHLQDHPRSALFLEMGLGKTASVLSALTADHLPALVVAPKRVAETVWPEERAKWRPDLSVAVAAGSPTKRAAILKDTRFDVTVIGRDNIADAIDQPWKTVVLDELSGFKNKTSKRWRAARKLADRATYVWGLTGTPAPNGLIDLWAQVYLLDRGVRLGETLTQYRERYFTEGNRLPSGVITEWRIRPGADGRIHRLLSDICLSMEAVDHLDLEPVTINRVAVPLPAKGLYQELKQNLTADLDLLDGTIRTASNAAVLSGKLSQITAGFIYPDADDPTQETRRLHSAKLDAVKEIIDGTGSPVLVFYRFRAELEELAKLPGAATIDQPGVIGRWNAGKVPVLLAHPASAGHGLNLQHGGHTVVWTTPPWSLEEWGQANARLARQGQTHPVVIHCLVCPDTIDGVILDRLETKKSVEQALMDYLK